MSKTDDLIQKLRDHCFDDEARRDVLQACKEAGLAFTELKEVEPFGGADWVTLRTIVEEIEID